MQNQKHKRRAEEVSEKGEKKARESFPIQGKGCVVLQPRCP